ncbi:unnamed protein product, partial [Rotaria sordida]
SQISDHSEHSSSRSSVSTTTVLSPTSPIKMNSKRKSVEKKSKSILDYLIFYLVTGSDQPQSAGGTPTSPNVTPKSPRKMATSNNNGKSRRVSPPD